MSSESQAVVGKLEKRVVMVMWERWKSRGRVPAHFIPWSYDPHLGTSHIVHIIDMCNFLTTCQ